MDDELARAYDRAAKADDLLREELAEVTRVREARRTLMATGVTNDKRVTVVLDADGRVVETVLADDVHDLSPEDLASAFTTAAQAARRDLERQTAELERPMREKESQLRALAGSFGDGDDDGVSLDDLLGPVPRSGLQPEPRADADSLSAQQTPGVKDSLW